MRFKYIITEHGNFAIFTEGLQTHQEAASRIFGKVVGAGFCTIAPGYISKKEEVEGALILSEYTNVSVHCFGESVSLGIKSREEDGDIITKKINDNESWV